MSVQLSNPLHTFALLREELIDYWDKCMWDASEERREMIEARINAHERSMKEGYQSPYTHPDDYDVNWRPIVKRQKGD